LKYRAHTNHAVAAASLIIASVISIAATAGSNNTEAIYWPGIRALHPVPIRWEKVSDGFETTRLKFVGKTRSHENPVLVLPRSVEMVAFRIDPARYPVKVFTARELFASPKARLGSAHKKTGALLSVNGGYFHESGDAVGLVVTNGKKRSEWKKDGGSGVLAVFGKLVRLDWARKIKDADSLPDFALQNGPLLIEPGGKFGMMHRRDKYHPRTVVVTDESGKLLIAVTRKRFIQDDIRSGLNLFETAVILHNPIEAGGFGATAAMNLDGGTSTGMKFKYGVFHDQVKVGIKLPNFVCVMPPENGI